MKNHISDFFDFLFFSYWSSKNDLTVIFSSWAYFVTHIFWDIVDFINDFVNWINDLWFFWPTKYGQKWCLSLKMRNVLNRIFVFLSFFFNSTIARGNHPQGDCGGLRPRFSQHWLQRSHYVVLLLHLILKYYIHYVWWK